MIRILNTADLHLGAVFPELADRAASRRADAFYCLEIYDRISLLGSFLLEDSARRENLQGMLIRKAQSRAARLSEAERPLLEAALRDILQRREPMHGEQ